jgi:type IV pilus biogenesis protein PilP
MSFRNVASAASIALAGLLAGAAAAEPSAAPPGASAMPADSPIVPDAPAGECLDLDGKHLAAMDCLEHIQHLDLQVKRLEAWGKIEEARTRIAEAKRKREEIEHPPAPSPTPAPNPNDLAPAAVSAPPPEGRLLEIFGDQARIRWRGGDYLVRPGQRLPGGAQIVQVSLEGAVIAEGKQRTTLPFVIGTRP